MYLTTLDSPFGQLTLSASDSALTGLWIEGQKGFPAVLNGILCSEHPIFIQTSVWLDAYFSGTTLPPPPPLDPHGTPFQKAVWQQLLEIPYGETTTYGAITNHLHTAGHSASAQAVGGAVGRNPILLLIPCHRVIGANGSLTGYAAGLDIKRNLLLWEQKYSKVL